MIKDYTAVGLPKLPKSVEDYIRLVAKQDAKELKKLEWPKKLVNKQEID